MSPINDLKINGDTNANIRVMAQAMMDCSKGQDKNWADNRQEHDVMYDRLRNLEIGMATINTKLVMSGAVGAILGGGLMQLIIKLLAQ